MHNNDKTFENILNSSNGKINRKALENAAKTGNADSLVKSLSQEDKNKLNEILSDKQKLSEVLKSPQAALLLKFLQGGKGKNGWFNSKTFGTA